MRGDLGLFFPTDDSKSFLDVPSPCLNSSPLKEFMIQLKNSAKVKTGENFAGSRLIEDEDMQKLLAKKVFDLQIDEHRLNSGITAKKIQQIDEYKLKYREIFPANVIADWNQTLLLCAENNQVIKEFMKQHSEQNLSQAILESGGKSFENYRSLVKDFLFDLD